MSDIRLTAEELAAMPEKTKKHPEVVQMYLEHPFETAYSMHTNWRVKENGYRGAIGAEKDWERHGDLQRDFLRSQGMRKDDMILEVGCGTGRLARKLVPILNRGAYYGVDLSNDAVEEAFRLAREEGWMSLDPSFYVGNVVGQGFFRESFDFVWAFSVYIHCPFEIMCRDFDEIAKLLSPDGAFLFSWTNEPEYVRSGLKQFRHTKHMYETACKRAGLTFRQVDEWSGEQLVAEAKRR